MKRNTFWHLVEALFLFAGLAMLDYYIWEQASTGLSQSYASWSFDRQLRGQPVSIPAFLSDQLHAITHRGEVNESGRAKDETPAMVQTAPPQARRRPADNELIGRLEIPRVGVRAIVREGTDSGTLERAVGHVPFTALPGEQGNVAVAAHRDTFFRGLAQIRPSDVVTFETMTGKYRYQVEATRIVSPKEVSVIRPTPDSRLTLITCYPFHYIGSAPERFIVTARQIDAAAVEAGTIQKRPAKARVARLATRAVPST